MGIDSGDSGMDTLSTRESIVEAIGRLPVDLLEELAEFITYLEFKNRERRTVALGGLWRDQKFDVTDEDVRALRRHVSAQVRKKV